MNSTSPDPTALNDLAGLLRRRLEVIADHAWRDRDPDGQLEALKDVSLEINAVHEALAGQVHAKLNHFLTQCSYDKALAFIEES
ncbi:MAG: hypothetical protein ACI8XO_005077 [Verrucomicrobiales bacterium]|jgi:hypothetical protein